MEFLSHQFHRYFVDNGASSWWLTGLRNTLLITIIALLIGVILGFTVAIIRSTHEQTGKLKVLNAVCKVCVTVCRKLLLNEGNVAGYVNRMKMEFPVKWGVQIAGMIFQICDSTAARTS